MDARRLLPSCIAFSSLLRSLVFFFGFLSAHTLMTGLLVTVNFIGVQACLPDAATSFNTCNPGLGATFTFCLRRSSRFLFSEFFFPAVFILAGLSSPFFPPFVNPFL